MSLIKNETFRLQGKAVAQTKTILKLNKKYLILESAFTIFNEKELREFIDWLIIQMVEME